MHTSTRNAANRPSLSATTTSSANRPGAYLLATRCPFCQSPIGLAHGASATSVCPNCGLRFTIESPQRSRGSAAQQTTNPGGASTPAHRTARFVLPATVLALASAATAALARALLR